MVIVYFLFFKIWLYVYGSVLSLSLSLSLSILPFVCIILNKKHSVAPGRCSTRSAGEEREIRGCQIRPCVGERQSRRVKVAVSKKVSFSSCVSRIQNFVVVFVVVAIVFGRSPFCVCNHLRGGCVVLLFLSKLCGIKNVFGIQRLASRLVVELSVFVRGNPVCVEKKQSGCILIGYARSRSTLALPNPTGVKSGS